MLPFRAIWSVEPWGILYCAPDDVSLFTGSQWLKHRGGMRAHHADVRAGRTLIVDHIRFDPRARPGLSVEHNRSFARINLPMVLPIFDRNGGVDEQYLSRCFGRGDAQRMCDAMHVLACSANGKPVPRWLEIAAMEI